MILFLISFSLHLLKISPLSTNAVPLENLKYFYKPVFASESYEISIKDVDVFGEKGEKILSISTRGESGFYFSRDLRYAIGIKRNTLNLYKNGKFIRSLAIESFYGGHFSEDKFIARVRDGVVSFDEKEKKFYGGLIDLYYLEDAVLKIASDRIWIERKEEIKELVLPPYIRKISVSSDIISYATKNEIYLYNLKGGVFRRIRIRGSITSLFAGKRMIFVGVLQNRRSRLEVFDLMGDRITEKYLDNGFISKIYQEEGKVYILKDKNLIVFEIK